jgi:hypothetical protein
MTVFKLVTRLFKFAILGTIAFALLGCVASQSLRPEDRKAIHHIFVDTAVPLPAEPLVLTRSQQLTAGIASAVGGAVGGAIAGSGGGGDKNATVAYLEANQIRVGDLLARSFIDEINARQVFHLVDAPATAEAVIKLEVLVYGLGPTANMFGSGYRPLMNARATMSLRSGKVIWVKQVVDTAMDGSRPDATYDDLYGKPEVMREQMTILTHAIASELVRHLEEAK